MKNDQKGAASLLLIIILLLIIGGIWWSYDRGKTKTTYTNPINYSIGTSTPSNTSTTSSNDTTDSTALSPNSNTGVTTQPTVISGNSNVFPGGSEYRSPYGLTLALPASWQAYALTTNSTTYGGVTPTNSTTFRLAGGPVLTINVFTKEQWNKIKTEENAANQNVSSLGEGEYLGENATYIYSYIIHDRETEVKQILGNIINF
jgi:hypothetical protein